MILQQILHNPQHYPYTVIIDDSNSKNYTPFLLHKVFNAQQTTRRIICVTSDVPSRSTLYRKHKSLLNIISTIQMDSVQQVTDSILSFVNRHQNTDDIPCILVLDSLSSLVYQYGFDETVEFVSHLQELLFNHSTSIDSIVAVIHSDAHMGSGGIYDDQVNTLRLRAHGIIEIQDAHDLDSTRTYFFGEGDNEEEKILDKKQIHFKCDLMSMRPRSKLLSHEEFYKVLSEDDCVISHIKHPFIAKKKKKQQQDTYEQQQQPQQSIDTNQKSTHAKESATTAAVTTGLAQVRITDHPQDKKDIQRQLPFKVDLSRKEQEDRERVVLPYVTEGRALNQGVTGRTQQQQHNKGFIIVDSDSDDDEYDSDDPDADLDI